MAATGELAGRDPTLPDVARAIWSWSAAPQRRALFGLFFAVYGRAVQAPQLFAGFLEHVVADWTTVLVRAQGPDVDPAAATRAATTVIATIRGLLLDLLATGDRERVEDAGAAFLDDLAARHGDARPPVGAR